MKTQQLLMRLLVVIAFFMGLNWLNAQNQPGVAASWLGTTNTNWHTASNWSNHVVPTATTDVTIKDNINNRYPVLSAPGICKSINIQNSAFILGNSNLTIVNNQVWVQRVVLGNLMTQWHYISSPIADATASTFMGWLMNHYIESLRYWDDILDPATPLTVTRGFAVAPDYGGGLITYTGTALNYGNYTANLSYTPDITMPDYACWNLIGNPYPSAIDYDLIPAGNKVNVDASIATWNYATGSYIYWNGLVGGITNGILPLGQGFFVRANAAGGSVTFAEVARTANDVPLYKSSVDNLLVLNVTNNVNAYADEHYINFNDAATTGYDGQFDAYKLANSVEAPSLFSYTDDQYKLAINTLPSLESTDMIQLGFHAGVEADYTLTISGLESFNQAIPFYLEDKVTGNITNLRETNVYSFHAVPGADANRFIVHLNPVGIKENSTSGMTIYSNGHSVYVNAPASVGGEVSIMNITGQEIAHQPLTSGTLNVINVDSNSGYYFVKVISGNTVSNKKVFIQ